MAGQQSHIQKQGLQSAPATPTSTAFQSRPFEPPQAEIEQSAPNNLQAQLQHAQQFGHTFANTPIFPPNIQTKLTIGKPNDKYEQEADRVAAQVVSRLSAPEPVALPKLQPKAALHRKPLQPLQRSQALENKLQPKPLANSVQRITLPEKELQMKPAIQRRSDPGGKAASGNLETSINRARGGGQSLSDSIRQPMEQAFGSTLR